MGKRPNIVVIVSDTLRVSHLGCYGNRHIRTPNIDRFAAQSVRFLRCHPESLPTIPVRRALHTGRRSYPFRSYRPLKWDIVHLPGWQPMDNEEDTLAESLAQAGYHTGFITDTLPYFAPGMNFHRGFWQWEFIRGQQQDRWRSPFAVSSDRLRCYGDPNELLTDIHGLVPTYLANSAHIHREEDTCTARVFSEAIRFLHDNQKGQPFYLLIDSFAPHEPWEAPRSYYEMYGDPNYSGRRIVHCHYGPAPSFGYTSAEIAYVHAHYCGLVSLVDTWIGRFLDALDDFDLSKNTVVCLTSDHGTNFCDNPRQVIGKPEDAMYPGVMRLPLIIRIPDIRLAGTTRSELVYNLDLTATLYDLVDLDMQQSLHGQSLLSLLSGKRHWHPRPYVTCRYGHSLCYIDDQHWLLGDIEGNLHEAFALDSDPSCQNNIAAHVSGDVWKRAWDALVKDADGAFPDYRDQDQTDAIGQRY